MQPHSRYEPVSSGVMVALQILVLPDKVRILARQHKITEWRPATDVTGFFVIKDMITKEHITNLVTEALIGSDRFIVDVTITTNNVISIYIDADSSISIDNCVDVSRYIKEHLDQDIEEYELNVSSAGINHPLLKYRQLKKYIDKDLEITNDEEVKKNYKLLSFDEEHIEVQEAVIKKFGKLTKTVYLKPLKLNLKEIKEIKPYINF